MQMREFPLFALLLAAQTAHPADSAAGCYRLVDISDIAFPMMGISVPHIPRLQLAEDTPRKAAALPQGAKRVFTYSADGTISDLWGYWIIDQNETLIVISIDGRSGSRIRLQSLGSGIFSATQTTFSSEKSTKEDTSYFTMKKESCPEKN